MEIQTIKELKALISLMEESSLTEIKIKNKDEEITLSSKQQVIEQVQPTMAMPTSAVVEKQTAASVADKKEAEASYLTAPLVGTFYVSSSPDEGAYVEVGTKVKKGDVICIIEAMKVMNEISADRDGVVTEILVDNAQLVDFDMKLFRIES